MAIDVGPFAIDRASEVDGGATYISRANAANATGLIFFITIYATNTMSDIEVAAFAMSGNDATTRGLTTLANASAGETTYRAADGDFIPFEIRTGDYIGIFFNSAGNAFEFDDSGGSGVWVKSGDQIPCVGETFNISGWEAYEISLYGAGYQLGQVNIGDAWKDIQNIKINVGDDWKQIVDGKINISDAWKSILS